MKSRAKTDSSMNIIIVGCGKIGQNLVEQLNEPGHNITVIDLSAKKVNDVSTRFDVMGVIGNGANHEIQQEAGVQDADLLIAVTGSDELNIFCCLIAKMFSRCQTIARIQNPDYSEEAAFLKDELRLAMVINPGYAAAREIARVLRFPSALKIDTFAGGKVELVKFRLPEKSPLVGLSVRDVVSRLRSDVLICTIERGDKAYIAKADLVFEEKDVISLVSSPKAAQDFFSKIKYNTNSVKNVMIVGGGEIGRYLCSILPKEGVSVKLIEKDPQICEELCTDFPEVTVICGNAHDQETLLEEGIEKTEAFVALTGMDEENILISLFAKSVSRAKIVTKINRFDFLNVVNHLDLDTIIYPKNVTSDVIVRYVRAMKNTIGSNVETLYNIIKGQVEASEFIVKEGSEVIGSPLSALQFKDNILIAAILRDGNVIIPRGSDQFFPGDRVVIVSPSMTMRDISDVLR